MDDNLITIYIQEKSSCPYATCTSPVANRVYKEFVCGDRDKHLSIGLSPDVGVIEARHLTTLTSYLESLSFKVVIAERPTRFFWNLRDGYCYD